MEVSNEYISKNITINYKKKPVYQFLKRLFDIVSSLCFLILFGWFILLLMLIKWIEDFGSKSYKMTIVEDENGKYTAKDGKKYNVIVEKDPNGVKDKSISGAIYTSLRVGKNGKIIKFHKIRSMCPGAENMKDMLLKYQINEADGAAFKLKDDPRITKFGKFLRHTSLDELPQIWDIFLGRLSVVGPRSALPKEVLNYTDYQKQRFLVKGGLLCLWQIQHDRNKIKFNDWVDLDLEYIEKRSIFLDLKILFKGAWMVLFDKSGE